MKNIFLELGKNVVNFLKLILNFFLLIDKYGIMVIVLNILIFFILQFLFFYFIIQNQYTELLRDKANILISMMKKDQPLNIFIKSNILSNYNIIKLDAKINKILRDKVNYKLIINYIVLPIMILIGTLIFVLITFRINRSWNMNDTLSVFMIILAYVTEIYYYFMIVKKYPHIGDIQIVDILVKYFIRK